MREFDCGILEIDFGFVSFKHCIGYNILCSSIIDRVYFLAK
jgi:hypothetical protein